MDNYSKNRGGNVGTDTGGVSEKIAKLKQEKKAVLLAHNYQRPEIQDIADYVGDSVELSRRAMEEKDAEIIVFSAVDFMAETAAILNPDKRVFLPLLGAKCPMARMLPADLIKVWKTTFPDAPLVLYVNSSAEAKAECDICCTSANAVEVVESLGVNKVLFGPDQNLAWYIQRKIGEKIDIIPMEGFCPTHELFHADNVLKVRKEHPDAILLVHPENRPEVQMIADFIGSTSQMCRYAKDSPAKKFIIATEVGLLYRLKKENPDKTFIPAYEGAICPNMKLNTLESIYLSLRDEKHLVTVPPDIAKRARRALDRMFEAMKK
jgi:quinolinate synthase